MRRITDTGANEESEVDITPLIDVVFIMLIFFIVTASFVKETGIDVNKPDNDQPLQVKKDDANILITIDANNAVWINQRKIDPRAVSANIEGLRAEHPDGKVIIRADPESRNEMLVLIMDASRQAGVYDIALAE